MNKKTHPTDDRLRTLLENEAKGFSESRYPGRLIDDIRPNLAMEDSARFARWLSVAATVVLLIVATVLFVSLREPRPRERMPSPFQTIALSPSRSVPASPPPPNMGYAFTLGSKALGQVRPPQRAGHSQKEKQ